MKSSTRKLKFWFEPKRERTYVDLLPQVSVGWCGGITVYVGWLFWNFVIISRKVYK